jgi:hypothetical protein
LIARQIARVVNHIFKKKARWSWLENGRPASRFACLKWRKAFAAPQIIKKLSGRKLKVATLSIMHIGSLEKARQL